MYPLPEMVSINMCIAMVYPTPPDLGLTNKPGSALGMIVMTRATKNDESNQRTAWITVFTSLSSLIRLLASIVPVVFPTQK